MVRVNSSRRTKTNCREVLSDFNEKLPDCIELSDSRSSDSSCDSESSPVVKRVRKTKRKILDPSKIQSTENVSVYSSLAKISFEKIHSTQLDLASCGIEISGNCEKRDDANENTDDVDLPESSDSPDKNKVQLSPAPPTPPPPRQITQGRSLRSRTAVRCNLTEIESNIRILNSPRHHLPPSHAPIPPPLPPSCSCHRCTARQLRLTAHPTTAAVNSGSALDGNDSYVEVDDLVSDNSLIVLDDEDDNEDDGGGGVSGKDCCVCGVDGVGGAGVGRRQRRGCGRKRRRQNNIEDISNSSSIIGSSSSIISSGGSGDDGVGGFLEESRSIVVMVKVDLEVKRFPMNYNDTFCKLFADLATELQEGEDHLMLLLNDTTVHQNESPASLKLRASDILVCLVSKDTDSDQVMADRTGPDIVQLVIQSNDHKKYNMNMSVGKFEPFQGLLDIYRKKQNLNSQHLKLYFDGDLINTSLTPAAYGLLDGDCLDLVQT